MFTDRYFAKKREKRRATSAASTPNGPEVQDQVLAPKAEGLSLDEYAVREGLSEAEVWKRLRRGELIGRTQKGTLYVFSSPAAAMAATNTAVAVEIRRKIDEHKARSGDTTGAAPLAGASYARDEFGLPVFSSSNNSPAADLLPDVAAEVAAPPPLMQDTLELDSGDDPLMPDLPPPPDARRGAYPAASGGFLALTGERAGSPELALLLDHLSLAKEENREILKMTQESIRKVSELSDTIVEMKDAVIEAKDAQINALREQLQMRDRALKELRQHNEDLEMLTRTVMHEHPAKER